MPGGDGRRGDAMKVMVGIKRVLDYNVRVQVKPDGTGVMLDGVKMSMNPFDEIALEEAIRLREAGRAAEVVAVAAGLPVVQEQLRAALALGADRAVHLALAAAVQPLNTARLLAALARRERPGLILMGKQAIDDDCSQTPQMLAALLGWPQATFASKIELADGSAVVAREVDAGLEYLEVDLPAVISADLRLNVPRYAKLPDIVKARRLPIETMTVEQLGVELAPEARVLKVEPPPRRPPGRKVSSVGELVSELRERGLL
jgi:electron transfer flavoprotein beta subunit